MDVDLGTSLEVQEFRVYASTAAGMGSILSPGTKIPHAAWCSEKKKKKKKRKKKKTLLKTEDQNRHLFQT